MASTLEGLKTSLSSPSKTVIIIGVVLILGVLLLIAGAIMLGIGIHKSNQKEKEYITNPPIYITNAPGGSSAPANTVSTQTVPTSGSAVSNSAVSSTAVSGSDVSSTAVSGSAGTGPTSGPSTSGPMYNLDNITEYSPIVADIVILLDISSATDSSTISDINAFFNQTFQAFNISTGPNSPGYIHFAILRVPGDSWGAALVAADFNTVTSFGLLQMALKNAAADPIYDPPVTAGQSLLNQ
uniref:VWFA domain-containing protein n=2 Tax=Acrobeloides nanus TaxID=290746 RepID=A0A914D4X9_9BILA